MTQNSKLPYFPYKVGLIGAGNLTQSLIQGWLDRQLLQPHQILVSNRSPGKLQKVADQFKVTAMKNNEELIEKSEIVVLAMKPQDLATAIDPLISIFNPKHIVLSLAAGITVKSLSKKLPNCRIARILPTTTTAVSAGVCGYTLSDSTDLALKTMIEDLFSPISYAVHAENEEQLETILVAAASGTGFIFELMTYWQDWIEEHGFEPDVAKEMTIATFRGVSELLKKSKDSSFEDLLNKVASKKGTTAAGLESMRELEIERALRYSFEKAALRNQELAKES